MANPALSGLYVINEMPIQNGACSQNISFKSRGTQFVRFYVNSIAIRYGTVTTYTDSETLYPTAFVWSPDWGGPKWGNETYRIVDFGTMPQEVSEAFYTWFTANATPVPYPLASEVTLSPQSVELTAGQAQDIQFTLIGTDGMDYTGIAVWVYVVTDKNAAIPVEDAPWVSWVEGQKGLLRITSAVPGGHEVTVIAAWGTEDDPQDLWATVTIPVTRVSEVWLRSFQTGLALGLAGKPLPIKKEPVAYLYNGVRLPKLPDPWWEKEKYPCAYIMAINKEAQGEDFDYGFIFSASAREVTEAPVYHFSAPARYIYIDGAWVEEYGAGIYFLAGSIIWSNTDVYYDSDVTEDCLAGTLYLAASEPVPVYE